MRDSRMGMTAYLYGQRLHSLPIHPRQHVLDEERVHINLNLLKLCFLWVQWEGGRIGLARFASASEEV